MQSFLLVNISSRTANLSRALSYLLVSYGYDAEGASAIKTCQARRSLFQISVVRVCGRDLLAHMAADTGEQMGRSLGGTGSFLRGSE